MDQAVLVHNAWYEKKVHQSLLRHMHHTSVFGYGSRLSSSLTSLICSHLLFVHVLCSQQQLLQLSVCEP